MSSVGEELWKTVLEDTLEVTFMERKHAKAVVMSYEYHYVSTGDPAFITQNHNKITSSTTSQHSSLHPPLQPVNTPHYILLYNQSALLTTSSSTTSQHSSLHPPLQPVNTPHYILLYNQSTLLTTSSSTTSQHSSLHPLHPCSRI